MKKLVGIFCLVILFASCRNSSFIPAYHNVPIFTGKNQVRVEQCISNNGYDAGFATAPFNHLGTQLNIHATANTLGIEPAIGGFVYFHPLVIELYTGYGFIEKKFRSTGFLGDSSRIDIRANRYFLQPSLGFHFNDYIELALSARISDWEFTNYDYKTEGVFNVGYNQKNLHDLDRLLIEPAFTLKAGGKFTKAFTQFGRYYDPYETNTNPDIYETNISPWFFRFGISMAINWSTKKGESHDNVRRF
jgi:hypothetical protein